MGKQIARHLQGRLALASFKAKHGWEDLTLDTIEPKGLHSVLVNATLGGSGPPGPCGLVPPVALASGATASIVPLSGVVEVDGEATGTICEMSEAVAWPLPPAGVQLQWEQFVVLRPE